MKKYLVIGNPIDHSLSPKLHNFWIKKSKINAIYEKKRLEDEEIEEFVKNIKKNGISGLNVTVPFKKKIIKYLDKLSPNAKYTQSVNTIVLDDNFLVGYNTDIGGFTNAIKNLKFEIKGKRVFILGAGGVVSSIVFALNKMEVSEITVANRTRQKAENLRDQFKNIKVIEWGAMCDFDLIINATSLGLKNEVLNLNFANTGSDKLFYDIIYNPTETNFLKEAKKRGNRTENGKLMFIYQAKEAFKLWHGVEPEINNETLKLVEND